MLLTLFGISVLIFVMLRLVPGNITDIIFDSAGFVNTKQKQRIERELGLDQPIVTQYVRWIGGLARGDLGYAYVSEKPAIQEIAPRIPVSAKLAALALVFSTLFGVTLGVLSAVRQDTALDYVLRVVTIVGIEAAFLIGGLIVTETVFNIPGVARFLVEAIRWRDYPIVQNLVMLIAIVVVLVNFLVDMLYMVLDPRIKFGN